MNFKDIVELLSSHFNEQAILEIKEDVIQPYLVVEKSSLKDICLFLKNNESLFFDYLACVTGIDNGPEAGTMEVIYHFNSIPFQHQFILKVVLPRSEPIIETVSDIWKTANWHERETYDLVGIKFKNHPDLRRILLTDDWQGHPLRKDYKEQEDYHGIIVKY